MTDDRLDPSFQEPIDSTEAINLTDRATGENGLCLYTISREFAQIFNRCVEKAPPTRSNLCIEAFLTNHGLDDSAYPQEVVHVRRLLDVAVRT